MHLTKAKRGMIWNDGDQELGGIVECLEILSQI